MGLGHKCFNSTAVCWLLRDRSCIVSACNRSGGVGLRMQLCSVILPILLISSQRHPTCRVRFQTSSQTAFARLPISCCGRIDLNLNVHRYSLCWVADLQVQVHFKVVLDGAELGVGCSLDMLLVRAGKHARISMPALLNATERAFESQAACCIGDALPAMRRFSAMTRTPNEAASPIQLVARPAWSSFDPSGPPLVTVLCRGYAKGAAKSKRGLYHPMHRYRID